MQLLATAGQMQQFDRSAITQYSIDGLLLMENAGRKFADLLESHLHTLSDKAIVVLCGKGNNGGDGFVIARHAANAGARVTVCLCCRANDVSGDARKNLAIVKRLVRNKHSSITFRETLTPKSFPKSSPDIIVDALFGTGFKGEVEGIYKLAIEWANARKAWRVAVDIPSGVNGTTGAVENLAFKADLTITMGLGKVGHYVASGPEYSGRIEIADIGIPKFLLTPSKNQVYRVSLQDVREVMPERPRTAHKNSVGRIFVLGGSRTLGGAPVMTALAAMKSGAGAVVLGVPKSLYPGVARRMTEVMVTPLEETNEGSVSLAAFSQIEERLSWADVVAIGPGLSQNRETQKLLHKIVPNLNKPVVLDADGINAFAGREGILSRRKAPTILTPHVGELNRIFSRIKGEVEKQRIDITRQAAITLKSILCLKGAPTTIGTPSGSVYVNSTGNPGMATAGSGDVLTGMIAALVGQGMQPEDATYCGVYLHGLAGDIEAERIGEKSLMAMDILEGIPAALQQVTAT